MHPKDFNSLVASIKRTFSRSTIYIEVLNAAKCPRKKGPQGGARYRCAICKKDFGRREVQVDHIDPVIPIGQKAKDMTFDQIISRLYCDATNLQVLDKKCHKLKSTEENKQRRASQRKS